MEKQLRKRLTAVAESIPVCESLVDVGCDHGYVAIYAAKSGKARRVTASDIKKGPLDRAKSEVEAEGLSDTIELLLCDGLCGIERHDCVVIAGMGGETIVGILAATPWIKDGCTLVLQPMTRSEVLREFLYNSGFEITGERIVSESGHLYCIITATYSGKCGFEPYEKYISKSALGDELFREYVDKVICRLEYEYKNKKKAGALSDEESRFLEKDIESLSQTRCKK